MEPFGLFSLLQSLLTNQNTQNEQKSESPSPPAEPENVQKSALAEQKTTAQTARTNADAFLAFLDEHERRAKLTKRKK
jgi:hypothetical protein